MKPLGTLGTRWLKFNAVGLAGVGVQLAALALFAKVFHWHYLAATAAAVEVAVLHNFAWHVRWTWADRPAGAVATAARLLRFNLANGGVSLLAGAALMPLLVHTVGLHFLLANLLTVCACAVINYLAGDRWVFAPAPR